MTHRFRALVLVPVALVGLALTLAACGSASATNKTSTTASSAHLIIMSDVIEGAANVPKDQAAQRSCVLTSRFPRNSEMVFRARVYDPVTGDLMDNKTVTSLQVHLANGVTVNMKYGLHPKTPPQEGYWTGSWMIPVNAPTGTISYTIDATDNQGRTGEFKPFNVQPSLPTITDEVLPSATGQ